jgi:hypothetical protein
MLAKILVARVKWSLKHKANVPKTNYVTDNVTFTSFKALVAQRRETDYFFSLSGKLLQRAT